jgi:ParB family chromosome partitioning protein
MKDHPVPCRVIEEADAVDASSAENILREAMHPADEFEAFRDMVDAGRPVEDVAARFGVTPALVLRRLKLAALSPRLLSEYRDGRATLEQMMALTLSDHHETQEAAWFEAPAYSRQPENLRARITQEEETTDSPLARYVGLDVYQAHGGQIRRDLFDAEGGGFLIDSPLLQRLAESKLVETAESVRVTEGWAWAEGRISFSYSDKAAFHQGYRQSKVLTEIAQAEVDRLTIAYDEAGKRAEDDEDEGAYAEAQSLSDQIDAITQGDYSAAEYALGGVVLSLDHEGDLCIERGLLRADDAKALAKAQGGGLSVVGAPYGGDAEGSKAKGGLSAPLILELTAKRTLAMGAALLDHPNVALASVVLNLIAPLLGQTYAPDSPIQIGFKPNRTDPMRFAVEGGETLAGQALGREEDRLRALLPDTVEALWPWLLEQDQATLVRILTFATAKTLDAVQLAYETAGRGRLAAADRMAEAISLDMADWWNSTAEDYFTRVSKPSILAAVTEGISQQAAENIAKLKKPEMAKAAERLLDGKGWLPSLLRKPEMLSAPVDDPVEAAAFPMAAE